MKSSLFDKFLIFPFSTRIKSNEYCCVISKIFFNINLKSTTIFCNICVCCAQQQKKVLKIGNGTKRDYKRDFETEWGKNDNFNHNNIVCIATENNSYGTNTTLQTIIVLYTCASVRLNSNSCY